LIYLPNADAAPTYAEVSARAARAFTHLATPKSASQVAAELDTALADAVEVIDSLTDLGVVTIER
jgi:kynureninase